MSLPWATARDRAIQGDRIGRLLDLAAEGVELVEANLAGGEGERKGQLQIALEVERVGDVLLVGDRVEREGDDRPAGLYVVAENGPGHVVGDVLGKIEADFVHHVGRHTVGREDLADVLRMAASSRAASTAIAQQSADRFSLDVLPTGFELGDQLIVQYR